MKTDKALIKALKRNATELPYSFENRVMHQILFEAERKGRLSYYRSLGLVSFVSLVLIAGMLYMLHAYFNINFLDVFARFKFSNVEIATVLTDQTRPIFAFSIYIGLLMLFLLGMDHLFRRRFQRNKKG